MRSFFILQTCFLVFSYLAVFDATIVVTVDSFLHYHSKKGTRLTALFHRQQQRNAKHWNGNYKKAINKYIVKVETLSAIRDPDYILLLLLHDRLPLTMGDGDHLLM